MNKREKIYSLVGFGKVFKFTISQTFKNKGFLASFILFVLCMTLMGPMQYMGQRAGRDAGDSTGYISSDVAVDNVYVYNQTPVALDADNLKELYESSEKSDNNEEKSDKGMTKDKLHIQEAADAAGAADSLGAKDVAVILSIDEKGYKIDGIISDDSDVSITDLDNITEIVKSTFDEKRLADSNVSEEDIHMVFSGVNTEGVKSAEEVLSEESQTVTKTRYMFYMLGFSMIIFIVVSMSTSYIITSVTEEKQSKLVESLLVSVRPMALLLGKVCGMMAYVVLILIGGVIGSNISNMVMKEMFHITESEFSNQGFNFSIFKDFGIGGGIALFFSIVLAFLCFGMISGLFGSTCNKTEDIQNATGNVMTISMLTYFGAIAVGAIDNGILNSVAALLPPFSFFSAPVEYVTGRIELPILILSYVIQLILLALILMLSAKSYRNLLLSDSTTQKFKTIFKSAKG